MKTFKYASEVYKKKYGKPTVIIYDNVNYLAHNDPEILRILQCDAKDNADMGEYIAVFVSDEEIVLDQMSCKYQH